MFDFVINEQTFMFPYQYSKIEHTQNWSKMQENWHPLYLKPQHKKVKR